MFHPKGGFLLTSISVAFQRKSLSCFISHPKALQRAAVSFYIFSMLHFKDILCALCVGLKASAKYRHSAHSLQRRCTAIASPGSPGEVEPLLSREACYLCIKISLGHIYSFQYLVSKGIFLCKRCWEVCHNSENEAKVTCEVRVVWEVGRGGTWYPRGKQIIAN